MLRILTLAVSAALLAAPASAESLRVSTAGKSASQIRADVAAAARQVCRKANLGAPHEDLARRICIQQAIRDGLAQTGNPALTRASGPTLALR